MNGLIRFSLGNPRAVTVLMFTVLLAGIVSLTLIPADILPVYRSPAVQVLTFYNGMAATSVESGITARMERGTGQAAGIIRQESRSLLGVSIIRNFFADDVDPSGALTQVNSLATVEIPTLPPGTLPPVILPYDPTSSTPVCLVALNSRTQNESVLYDTARYQVRMMIMASRGANAPVVYRRQDPHHPGLPGPGPAPGPRPLSRGCYARPGPLQHLHPGRRREVRPLRLHPRLQRHVRHRGTHGRHADQDRRAGRTIFLKEVAVPKDAATIQTNVVRVNGRRQVYIPVYRQSGYSTLSVVDTLKDNIPDMKAG